MRLIKQVCPSTPTGAQCSTYRVVTDGGVRVGLVVAERDRQGRGYGPRLWYGCWRLDSDRAARWTCVDGHRTRNAALAELLTVIAARVDA